MKRLTKLGLVIVVAALTCSAQQVEKRRPGKTTIFGPARSVRIERAEITSRDGQLIEGPRRLIAMITYNQDGTRLERTLFRADGSISDRVNEAYAPDGRILESTGFKGNGDPGMRMVYNYDGKKRLIEQTSYRPDGSIAHKTTFVYQENRRLHESLTFDVNGVVVSKVTGTLDLKTHRMETISQSLTEVTARQAAFTDTPEGQVFEGTVNGNQTELTFTHRLGKQGGEVTRYNPDGSVKSRRRFQSELDSHRNLVKQIELAPVNGSDTFRPVGVSYFTIEYYVKD
jgi:hypothetical protein